MPRSVGGGGATGEIGRSVTIFTSEGCHLCEQALAVLREGQAREWFEVEVVDITGDLELESEYRALIPVIEVDGVRAFTYFVTVDALLDRLDADGSRARRPGTAGTM